jgi:hypothetical protein
MIAQYRVEVRGEWGGMVGGWRPAITGILNQTGRDDDAASTTDTHEEAAMLLDEVILPELPGDGLDDDVRFNAPEFRIVEVSR